MRSRVFWVFLAFSLFPVVAASAQATVDRSIPTDPNASFRVGVSSFSGNGLSPDNEYLLQALPQLLVQTVSSIKEHHFDSVELSAYQSSVLEGAIAAQRASIDSLFQTRSLILFQNSDPESALKSSTQGIDAAEARLKFLQSLNPEKIAVEKDKPLELAKSSSGEALLSSPMVSASQTAKEHKLGLLIWGSIDQVEDYLVVHISIYDAAFKKDVFTYTKTLTPSNVLDSATETSEQVAKAVLGRDFGTLSLDVKPAGALVYLDGDFYGIGGATIQYLTTGAHRLQVRAPGYDEKNLTVFIAPFANLSQSVELVGHQRREVLVRSTPAGADVYVASEWRGKTPVSLPLPESEEAMVLRLSGYHDYTTTVGQQTSAKLDVRLMPDIFHSQDYIAGLRNRFYGTFGAFALSMIVPVSFYSLMQDYLVNLSAATSVTEIARLKNEISVWYYAYLGGAFISSALFTNMVINISEYLRAIH